MSSFKHVTPISPDISLQHGNDQSAVSEVQIRGDERFNEMDCGKVVMCNLTMFYNGLINVTGHSMNA
jgi:hypothetical protein